MAKKLRGRTRVEKREKGEKERGRPAKMLAVAIGGLWRPLDDRTMEEGGREREAEESP